MKVSLSADIVKKPPVLNEQSQEGKSDTGRIKSGLDQKKNKLD